MWLGISGGSRKGSNVANRCWVSVDDRCGNKSKGNPLELDATFILFSNSQILVHDGKKQKSADVWMINFIYVQQHYTKPLLQYQSSYYSLIGD